MTIAGLITGVGARLSHHRAASFLGTPFDTYLRFDRGKKAIPGAVLVRLQKAFGIGATWVPLGTEMVGSPVDFHPEVTRVFHRELTRLKVMFRGLCLGQAMRGLPFRFGYS